MLFSDLADLLGFEVFSRVSEAFGFKLCDDVFFYSLDDFMCSVAILLWICCVSAAASAHDFPFNNVMVLICN